MLRCGSAIKQILVDLLNVAQFKFEGRVEYVYERGHLKYVSQKKRPNILGGLVGVV